MSLVSTVRQAARRFGDRPAFVAAAGWAVSYEQPAALSDEGAAGLAADHGIGEGDLVALTLPSSPDYVVAYVAVAKLGAITAGINPRSTDTERAAVLHVAHPTLVLTPDPRQPTPEPLSELDVNGGRYRRDLTS